MNDTVYKDIERSDPWLKRLERLLTAMPAVVEVWIREFEDGWWVRVEYTWNCCELYINHSDVKELLELPTIVDCSSTKCMVFASISFDENDCVDPYYLLDVKGLDPSVLGASIERFERKATG